MTVAPTATTAVAEAEGTTAEEDERADIPTEESGIQEKFARRLVVGARVEKGKEEYQVGETRGLSGITWKNRGREKIGRRRKDVNSV